MARLLLIRHAPTPETGNKLTGRLPGVWLGEEGKAAAQRTASYLRGVNIKTVYTSPVERALETAQIVAQEHALDPVEEPGVTEVDFGTWAGRSFGQLRRTKQWATVQSVPSQARFPEGESFLEAQHRAVEACNRITARAGKGTVAVVSHSDVIKLVVSHYLGQPIDLFQRINISTASVTALHLRQGTPPFISVVNGTGERL